MKTWEKWISASLCAKWWAKWELKSSSQGYLLPGLIEQMDFFLAGCGSPCSFLNGECWWWRWIRFTLAFLTDSKGAKMKGPSLLFASCDKQSIFYVGYTIVCPENKRGEMGRV